MRTDDLIRGLAADAKREAGPGPALAVLLPVGLLVSAVLFTLMLRVRPDLSAAMLSPRLAMKFGVTLSLAVAALMLVLRQVRPGRRSAPTALALLIPLGLLAIGVAGELGVSAPDSWMTGLVGHNARFCVVLVPVMAAPILAALLVALGKGAPTRPALAGAVAGLAAGGLGAALYALHCTDDSPLFVAVWYGIGIGIVTLAGTLIGRRILAW